MTEAMREVRKDDFFAFVGPRDIVLRSETDHTDWETRSRVLVGRSTPGWKNPGGRRTYFLTEAAIAQARA